MTESADDEAALVRRVQGGETDAFEPLVDAWQDKIYHLVLRQCGNADDALDIAQDVFVKAFRKIELFRGDSSFGTWLYRIAINECRSRFRSKSRRPKLATLEAVNHEPESDPEPDTLETAEKQAAVHEGLAELDPSYSQPLILFHLQGHPHKVISEMLGIPLGTVKTRIHRGHKLLAEKMKKFGFFETSGHSRSSKGA